MPVINAFFAIISCGACSTCWVNASSETSSAVALQAREPQIPPIATLRGAWMPLRSAQDAKVERGVLEIEPNHRAQLKFCDLMKATLIIPSAHAPSRKFQLIPRRGRRGEFTGFQVSPSTFGRVLNSLLFQDLRDVLKARIETDDVESAAEILRLSANDPSLILRT